MSKITVLMSVYNAEKYIKETIHSVLKQTFNDFEFIIINDGSTDKTDSIVRDIVDDRIRYFKQKNQGVSKALNYGLKLARGKYIAKIDADDICYPNRLEKQYDFMEKNPEYVVCGCYADVIDEGGNYIYTYKLPSSNEQIQSEMQEKNCIVHSSAFYNKESALKIGGYYEPIKHYFEDYMLFYQLLKLGKAYNFDTPLIEYRITPGSISTRTKNKKYNKLVKNVISRGYILDHEKTFLFSFKKKVSKKSLQHANHHLTISRLILIHQRDLGECLNRFGKGIKLHPNNLNIIKTAVFIIIEILKIPFDKK